MQDYLESSRLARYRGIFADTPRKEALYSGLLNHSKKPNRNKPIVKASRFFIATTGRGPDGSFSVLPIDKPGEVAASEPIVKGHTSEITDIAFNPFSEFIVASASKDKSVLIWKIPRKGLTSEINDPKGTLEGHTGGVSVIKYHPTTEHLLVSAATDNTVRLWDVQSNQSIYSSDHSAVVDVFWNDIGNEFFLRSMDKDASLCDARSGNFISSLPGTAEHFIIFAGSSEMAITLDPISSVMKVWDVRNTSAEVKQATLDEPMSSDISPLFDADVKLLYLMDKSNRSLSIFDCSGRTSPLQKLFTYKAKSVGLSVALIPKRAANIAGCEIARVVKLTSDSIEPLSFSVPRIHDSFQEDLYPPTFNGTASQTKEQWLLENSNLPPVLTPLFEAYKDSEKANQSMFEVDGVDREKVDSNYTPPDADDDNQDSEKEDDEEDFLPRKLSIGTPFLKFGRRGAAQEKLLRLVDRRYLTWESSWFSLKFGRMSSVDLEKALRVQRGQMTTKFDRESKYYGGAKETSFSVIYIDKREEKSVDFIAQSKQLCDLWFEAISRIIRQIKVTREATALTTRFLKFTFELADADQNDVLSLHEVTNLLTELSVNSPHSDVSKTFYQVSNGEPTLKFSQFTDFMFMLRRRFDLEFLWNRLIENRMVDEVLELQISKTSSIDSEFPNANAMLPLANFVKFWRSSTHSFAGDINDEKNMAEEAESIIQTFMGDSYNKDDPALSYHGFFKLMNSETNDAFDPEKKAASQDVNQPLSYYYMYSSHNTYLEGDQVLGRCSVNRYINDLVRGVRCVELDTWDGPEGDPIITHGGTLVNTIKFIDVIKAIKTFAFVTSPYPIVLSIENHCNSQQQRRMAIIMRGIFGEMLLDSSEGYYASPGVELLSLEELREKILIKGVRAKGEEILARVDEEANDEDDIEDGFEFDDEDETNFGDDETGIATGSRGTSTRSATLTSGMDGSTDDADESASVDSADSTKKIAKRRQLKKTDSKLSYADNSSVSDSTAGSTAQSELSKSSSAFSTHTITSAIGIGKPKPHEFLSSITYFATFKYNKEKGFESTAPADSISSYNEDKMAKLTRKHLKLWIEHNKVHLR